MTIHEGSITDGVGSSDSIPVQWVLSGTIADAMTSDDSIPVQWSLLGTIIDAMTCDEANPVEISVAAIIDAMTSDDPVAPVEISVAAIAEAATSADVIACAYVKTLQDTCSMWETPKWGWAKLIADTFDISETLEKILGMSIIDILTLLDAQENTWDGDESVSDLIVLIDLPSVIETFEDLVADGMNAADAVNLALILAIFDILTCVETIPNTGSFQAATSESVTIEDIVSKAWSKLITDTFAATDVGTLELLVFLSTIADTVDIAETATRTLTISQTIDDALASADTATLQQLLFDLIADGLALDLSVELNDELWECWVLNTGSFHPSVYSGYDYNSFAVFDGIVYGCKSDGIYELSGTTDNGTAFHSGMVLPDTRLGSAYNKRFRKAFLGVSGDNLVMKVETESGDKTYKMTDTEISLTRDMKGRSWKFSFEDFDTLDFIKLIPVILTRK